MKRFFQSVQKEGSRKKRDNSVDENGAELEECGSTDGRRDPITFLSWNANSFLLRVKNNRQELFELIRSFSPDVIALQEVRVPAAGRSGEPKNPSAMKEDTSGAREDKQTILRALSVDPLSEYQVWWSLADSKYGGTGLFVKSCCKPLSVKFSIDGSSASGGHEPDGRVIIAEFRGFRLLNTYVPNNGWKDEPLGFQRRRKWDKRILEFVTRPCVKPLIWCGDLNVSHANIDVTHPEYFQTAKSRGYVPPQEEDIGQPGFTVAERLRFSQFLSSGDLIDSYRWLHKEQDMEKGFTWSGNPVGMYRGKRMRIDYFLIARSILPRLRESDILGSGAELNGFYGSDHCPITLVLSPPLEEKDSKENNSNSADVVNENFSSEPKADPKFPNDDSFQEGKLGKPTLIPEVRTEGESP